MAFERTGTNAEGRQRLYRCKYCDNAFTSSQALGGHQNGHRRERDVVNRVHEDPTRFFTSQNLLPPPLPNMSSHSIESFCPSLTLSHQGHNFLHPSQNLSPDLSYFQNSHDHQPFLFQQATRVDAGSSSRNYLFGSSFGNGGYSNSRTEAYWRLPNHSRTDAAATRLSSSVDVKDKENEIDLTLRL